MDGGLGKSMPHNPFADIGADITPPARAPASAFGDIGEPSPIARSSHANSTIRTDLVAAMRRGCRKYATKRKNYVH
jgi:hypothetical protein